MPVFALACGAELANDDTASTELALCVLGPIQFTPSAPGPVSPGTSVSVQASASCDVGQTPQFRLRQRLKGESSWTSVTAWGGPSLIWNTTGRPTGLYELRVETRAVGVRPGVESAQKVDYALGNVCSDLALTALAPTPQPVGFPPIFTAVATCPNGAVPEFRYSILRPGEAEYTVARDWSTLGNFTWDTNGESAGNYKVQVRVRALGNASAYEVKRASLRDLVDCAAIPADPVCVAPSVVSTTPADGAVDVSVCSNASLTFTKAMNASSLVGQTAYGACSGTIQLSLDGFVNCQPLSVEPTLFFGGTVAAVYPTIYWYSSPTYQMRVTTGATDLFGIPLNAPATITFSVRNESTAVVISQVYGGGGNAGATYMHDFIELHNRGPYDVDLSGWSVQYTGATQGTWQVTQLPSVVLPVGAYFLIQEAQGPGGTTPLPNPDAFGSIQMSALAGKVALVDSMTLSGNCPSLDTDLVAYGATADCAEGAPVGTMSNTTAAIRNGPGCIDTQNNAQDFQIGSPAPRSMTASPPVTCPDACLLSTQ